MIAGRRLIGISITEERAGSSLAETETTAKLDDGYVVLSGRKAFTTGGRDFGSFLVMARFGGTGVRGLGGVIVDTETPGFSVERTIPKMGGNAIEEAAIRFDGCRVPADQVLAPGDPQSTSGFKLMMQAYNQLRCGIAAICLGVAQAALDEIGTHLTTRHQSGVPLASFQGLRWRVAELAADLEAARLLTYRAAQLSDALGFPTQYETALAKLAASRLAVQAADEAVQMLGWRGVAREFPAERRYREVRGWTIAGGTTEALLEVVGARVLRHYAPDADTGNGHRPSPP
ncbi:MAG: acyl-CoA dehydrogenase [Actinomycetota bacterium]